MCAGYYELVFAFQHVLPHVRILQGAPMDIAPGPQEPEYLRN